MSVDARPVPTSEKIEDTAKALSEVYRDLPDNDERRAAQHFLEQSEKRAHRSREIGDMPYAPEEIP